MTKLLDQVQTPPTTTCMSDEEFKRMTEAATDALTDMELKGYDIEKTVTFANIASGLSVVKIGGRSSIPEYDEIMKYFLQKYPDEGTIEKETPPVIATEAGM